MLQAWPARCAAQGTLRLTGCLCSRACRACRAGDAASQPGRAGDAGRAGRAGDRRAIGGTFGWLGPAAAAAATPAAAAHGVEQRPGQCALVTRVLQTRRALRLFAWQTADTSARLPLC
jgi:hypothetical protein